MSTELQQTNPWYLYILLCADGSLYTGVARDLERRLHEHNHTVAGARYTRPRRPVTLAYFEGMDSRADACRREHEIKRMKAGRKIDLILGGDQGRLLEGGVAPETMEALRVLQVSRR